MAFRRDWRKAFVLSARYGMRDPLAPSLGEGNREGGGIHPFRNGLKGPGPEASEPEKGHPPRHLTCRMDPVVWSAGAFLRLKKGFRATRPLGAIMKKHRLLSQRGASGLSHASRRLAAPPRAAGSAGATPAGERLPVRITGKYRKPFT